jgi:hypothetical protein
VKVVDRREDWKLCERSRKRTPDVNEEGLSTRDAAVVAQLAS